MEGGGRVCIYECCIYVQYVWCMFVCAYVCVVYTLDMWFVCSICRREERVGAMCLCWEICSLCVCVLHAHQCAPIRVYGAWLARASRTCDNYLYRCSVPYYLETGFLTEPDAHWLGQASRPAISQNLPSSIPQSWDCSQLCPAFPAAAGCWKPGSRLAELSTLIG